MDFKNVFAHASMAHTFIANLHGSELLHLLDDGGNGACTNGTATLTDSETQTLLHSYLVDQLNGHVIRCRQACTSLRPRAVRKHR